MVMLISYFSIVSSMHSFCIKISEFPKFHPKQENIADLLLMELMGLIEHLNPLEQLKLIKLNYNHQQNISEFLHMFLITLLFHSLEKKYNFPHKMASGLQKLSYVASSGKE